MLPEINYAADCINLVHALRKCIDQRIRSRIPQLQNVPSIALEPTLDRREFKQTNECILFSVEKKVHQVQNMSFNRRSAPNAVSHRRFWPAFAALALAAPALPATAADEPGQRFSIQFDELPAPGAAHLPDPFPPGEYNGASDSGNRRRMKTVESI